MREDTAHTPSRARAYDNRFTEAHGHLAYQQDPLVKKLQCGTRKY